MAPTAEKDFEVWGDPIEHSLSPTLHRAAYAALGRNWSYSARTVTKELITPAWVGAGARLGGISLTMPLKERILDLVALRDPIVDGLLCANTVYRPGPALVLSNTDSFGVEKALERFGVEAQIAWILGAGATSRSVAHALATRGVEDIVLCARNTERAGRSAHILTESGLNVSVVPFTDLDEISEPDLVASTLPGDVDDYPEIPSSVVASASLFDVAYSPWPSHYAQVWSESSGQVVSGLWMLAYQALAQVRLFVHGDASQSLPDEDRVFDAMLDAVGLPSG